MLRLCAATIAAAALLAAPAGATTRDVAPDAQRAKTKAVVDHVADGDTIEVQIGAATEDVRFIGIDTPEVFDPVECGGPEAGASMERMLQAGDTVKLVRDRSQDNRDIYGRLLRYVEFEGRDLGKKQLSKGWASVYDTFEPFDRFRSYRRAAKQAKRANRGAWGLCGGF